MAIKTPKNNVLCKACYTEIDGNSAFCNFCGSKVMKELRCSGCNETLQENSAFCNRCGTKVGTDSSNNQQASTIKKTHSSDEHYGKLIAQSPTRPNEFIIVDDYAYFICPWEYKGFNRSVVYRVNLEGSEKAEKIFYEKEYYKNVNCEYGDVYENEVLYINYAKGKIFIIQMDQIRSYCIETGEIREVYSNKNKDGHEWINFVDVEMSNGTCFSVQKYGETALLVLINMFTGETKRINLPDKHLEYGRSYDINYNSHFLYYGGYFYFSSGSTGTIRIPAKNIRETEWIPDIEIDRRRVEQGKILFAGKYCFCIRKNTEDKPVFSALLLEKPLRLTEFGEVDGERLGSYHICRIGNDIFVTNSIGINHYHLDFQRGEFKEMSSQSIGNQILYMSKKNEFGVINAKDIAYSMGSGYYYDDNEKSKVLFKAPPHLYRKNFISKRDDDYTKEQYPDALYLEDYMIKLY